MAYRIFRSGDVDGFFGLFIDNLLQLMLVAVLGHAVAGLPVDLITHRILPAAALSILVGNLYYSWQAIRLAKASGRVDVTALPYGINTPSLLAYLFLIMGPIYQETKDPNLVWQVGIFACLMSGVLETVGSFLGEWLRRHTPRAALLASLAGIALTFIALGFIFQIFASPALAVVPMMLILLAYAGRRRMPFGLPGGLVAVLVGTGIAWGLRALGYDLFTPVNHEYQFGLHPPIPAPKEFFALISSPWGWRHMAIIFPMALFNLIGSLQNLESASAAGDDYPTRPCLLANGFLSILAAFFGSAFPTTIYIGHPAWKSMGARTGYSILNGIVITLLCLFGGITLVLNYIPLEVTLGILLWIGIIMTSQAYQEVPRQHALAVSVGLIPALAAYALFLIETALGKAGSSLFEAAPKFGSDLYIHGVLSLSQGFLLSSMVLASIVVFLIERDFARAALWTAVAAALSFTGLIHAYQLAPSGVQNSFGYLQAPGFGFSYAASALVFALYGIKASQYHFVTHWKIRGRVGMIYEILSDGKNYPQWWKPAYLACREVGKHRIEALVRAKLPYTLKFTTELVHENPKREIELRSVGELQGRGIWKFAQVGEWTEIEFTWDVEATKPIVRYLSFLVKPIFIWNHNWVMETGGVALQKEVNRRLTSDTA